MWSPLPPPRPGMSEETRESKLAAAKKKVKRAGSRLPDPAKGPSEGRAVARVCAAPEAHRASPSAPLGAPPKVFSASPAPRQPSPRPRPSPPGDFGPVTPGILAPGLALAISHPEPEDLGSPARSRSPRTSVPALLSPPPPRSGDSGVGREEWNVVTSQSPSELSLAPRARCLILLPSLPVFSYPFRFL